MALPRHILCVLISTICVVSLHAATLTVDIDNPGAADFGDLSVAIAAASPGDTLILAGSLNSYGSVTLKKELHLVGPGWFIQSNFPDASQSEGAIITKVTVNSSAGNGSSLRSLQIDSIDLDDCSDILIQRIGPTYSNGTVYLTVNDVANSTFRQNYRASIQGGTIVNTNSSLKILNNILIGASIHTATHNSEVAYNIIRGYLVATSGGTFRYNILIPDTTCQITLTNGLAEYNIVDGDANDTGNDKNVWPGATNINDADESTFFQSGTFDSRYKLAIGSEAANIDGNGTDAGPFGGDHPYVLSGMPSVPVIYKVDAPVTAQAGETINLSFKATAEPVIENDNTGRDAGDPLDL